LASTATPLALLFVVAMTCAARMVVGAGAEEGAGEGADAGVDWGATLPDPADVPPFVLPLVVLAAGFAGALGVCAVVSVAAAVMLPPSPPPPQALTTIADTMLARRNLLEFRTMHSWNFIEIILAVQV